MLAVRNRHAVAILPGPDPTTARSSDLVPDPCPPSVRSSPAGDSACRVAGGAAMNAPARQNAQRLRAEPGVVPRAAPRPQRLFVSYAHEDEAWCLRLRQHLRVLERRQVLEVWHDRRIEPGGDWAGEIAQALEAADIVVLLVSADFLASDYCYDREVARALQRHAEGTARVVPVVLRPCDWQRAPFGALQALPRDGQPVAQQGDGDAALAEVACALGRLAEGSSVGAGAMDDTPSTGAASPRRPAHPHRRRWAGAAAVVCLVLAWSTLQLHGAMAQARRLMRQADYAAAAQVLAAVPAWSRAWPAAALLAEQAAFGLRLARGEHVNSAPLQVGLQGLRTRAGAAPDVLVFEGLKAWRTDPDPARALAAFTQAAATDPDHVEAHFLAAGRQLDLAYAALGRGDAAPAREAALQSRRHVDLALARAPDVVALPRYASQLAELLELEGRDAAALQAYARLAPQQTLSALLAAFVAWRVAEPATAVRHAREAAEGALQRMEAPAAGALQTSGAAAGPATEAWLFRLGPTDLVDVRSQADQRCLLAWAVEVSRSLQDPLAAAAALPAAPVPSPCQGLAGADSLRDVVCVQLLAAQQALAAADPRRPVLARWHAQGLRCPAELQALPTLPPPERQRTADGLPRVRLGAG